VARLDLHRRPACPDGEGEDPCPDPRTSQLDLERVLISLNQVVHGWANYFRHAVAKRAFAMLDHLAWWRVIRMLRTRHRRGWKDVHR
jgi:RNA-directed DNA polymerase